MSRRPIIAALAACLAVFSPLLRAAPSGDACVPGYAIDACGSVERCEARLRADPYDLPARMALCEALVAEGNLLDAMVVLRHGLEGCGGRSYACSQLQIALSNVEELAEKGTPDLRAERRRDQEFKRQYCLGPSASDESIQACNEALLSYGEDGALYEALGAKYQRRGQPAQAVLNLRRAVELLPEDPTARDMLGEARDARSGLSRACLAGGNLEDCNLAVLAGEPDELDLQRRRGELLLEQGRRDAALQALLSAQSLAPNDSALARRVLPLVEEALSQAPDEPELNAAQAAALAAAGDVDGAIAAFRRTMELNAGDGETARRLRELRDRRRVDLEESCFAAADIAACRQRLIPGEPDEQRIIAHVASLEAAEQAAAAAAATAQGDVEPSGGPPGEPSGEQPAGASAQPLVAAQESQPTPRIFRNAPGADGSTH